MQASKFLKSVVLGLMMYLPTEDSLAKEIPAPKPIIEQTQTIEKKTNLQQLENLLTQATDGKYDRTNIFYTEPLENLVHQNYNLYVNLEMIKKEYDYHKKGVHIRFSKSICEIPVGTCIVIGNKDKMYLVTNHHVIDYSNRIPEDEYDDKLRPTAEYILKKADFTMKLGQLNHVFLFPNVMDFIPLNRKTSIQIMKTIGLRFKVIASDPYKDIALLEEIPGQERKLIERINPVQKWGNTEELQPGHFIQAVGHPLSLGKFLTQGYVACIHDPYADSANRLFWADISGNFGSSGGAHYAFRDGVPEFIGITSLVTTDGNYIGVINVEHIKELVKKAGLEELIR